MRNLATTEERDRRAQGRRLRPAMWLALGLTSLVATGAAQASLIVGNSASFAEPDGGTATPGFSGTLSFELFDSAGGASALGGGAAPTLGSDYTLIFQVALDPDVDTFTSLASISMSAFQLGTGDGNFITSPGTTSGGPIGAADPTFSTGTLAKFANYDFTALPGGGLAEGTTSAAFYFTIPNVDIGPGGSTVVAVGDQLTSSFITVAANSVDIQLTIVPEPSTALLLGFGLVGLVIRGRAHC